MAWLAGKGSVVVWALTFVALFASLALAAYNVQWLEENQTRVQQSYDVLNELGALLTAMVDAETGQRGFIITGDAPYLQPYERSLRAIQDHQRRLRELRPDHAADRWEPLAALIHDRLELLQRGIDVRRSEGVAAARDHVLTGSGKIAMDALRQGIEEEQDTERQRLRDGVRRARGSYAVALVTGVFGSATALGMTAVAFLLVRRELKLRAENEASLRQSREELETRVHERTAELTLANTALVRSNSELEQFASVASHDLQEPLRKIQAFGDRLQTRCAGQLDEQARDYVARMMAAATRMRHLIEALLAFSRVSTRGQPFVPVDLGEIARDVVTDLEGRLHQTDGQVEVGDLCQVDADPLQMRQLFQNLIGNGLKFHRPGVPPIVRVTSRMLLGGDGEPAFCELTIADNGAGFDPAYRDRLFQVFQRLHKREEYEGTGIGLAICRKIVERHQGHIAAHGQPGQGAEFIVVLPLHPTLPGVNP